MEEIWKGVIYQGVDYSEFYEVSSLARFRNAKTKKVVKQNLNKAGYPTYVGSLGKRGLQKAFKIHKCVAEAFVSNPKNLPVVNHIDGDRTNNLPSNLEWCTLQDNITHAAKVLKSYDKGKNHESKRIKSINPSTNEIAYYDSLSQAAEKIAEAKGIKRKWVEGSISRALTGRRCTYDGFIWVYA